jgi:cardiolipin synthase
LGPVRKTPNRQHSFVRPRARRPLPTELRPQHVGRLAAALPEGLADPGFESLLERIDEGPFHPGNRVEVFFRGQDAFTSMLAAVDAARTEVLLEAYIFKDDEVGRTFATHLTEAARRGVTVRVLADGIGSFETRRGFWTFLRANGVDARLFHPIGLPLKALKFRDHRKILVTDRTVSFTGGMNIGEEYGSSLLPVERVWRDTHARVEGPAAHQMAVVFEEGWKRAGGGAIGLRSIEGAPGRGVPVLILDSRPGRGVRETASVLAAIIGAARRRVWITMAYFAPRTRGVGILSRAAARGVDVRLILPGKTDLEIVRHAGHGFYADLLQRGVRIFEYQPAILHAKTLVADGLVSVIGSTNFDFRSFEMNAECNFVIKDAETGGRMERQYEDDVAKSQEVHLPEWKRRFFLHRVFDGAARRLAPLL